MIIHNGFQYRVNFWKLSSFSQYFCTQNELSPDTLVSVNDEYSEETFEVFLDCLFGIKSLPTDEKLVDVYQLCLDWKCQALLGYINTQSPNFTIAALYKSSIIEQKVLKK